MKKSKFLIPALSVASVGAVVAPMVTSCAKTNGLSFEIFKTGLLQDYTPMKPMAADKVIFQKGTQGEENEEAMLAYGREVAKNPNILADDFINYAVQIYSIKPEEEFPKQLSMSVNNISVGFKTMEGDEGALFSFDSVIKYVDKDDMSHVMEVEFRNVPYIFNFVDEYGIANPNIMVGYVAMLYDMPTPPTPPEDPTTATSEEIIKYITEVYEYYQKLDDLKSTFNMAMQAVNSSFKVHTIEHEKDGTLYSDVEIVAKDYDGFWAFLGVLKKSSPFLDPIATNYFQNATVEEE